MKEDSFGYNLRKRGYGLGELPNSVKIQYNLYSETK